MHWISFEIYLVIQWWRLDKIGWMDHFLERHADTLKSVWGTSQTMLRGGAANPETIDHWFSLLSKTIAKSNGISTKFAGGKPLLRWFIEADDPETLLEDLQNPNGAFSPPAPNQTRRQCCETIMYEEDDREWSDENGEHND